MVELYTVLELYQHFWWNKIKMCTVFQIKYNINRLDREGSMFAQRHQCSQDKNVGENLECKEKPGKITQQIAIMVLIWLPPLSLHISH